MTRVLDVFLLPPLAIGRVGGSDQPLDAFDWVRDPSPHADHRTTIRPAVSLRIAEDGRAVPHLPATVRFRDAGRLRPVAPFFELWARVERPAPDDPDPGTPGEPAIVEEPVTLGLLRELGASEASVFWRVTIANKKAARRTRHISDSFVARAEIDGGDYERHELLGYSPHVPNVTPLVDPDRPIPLGAAQAVRPQDRVALGVDLSVLRLRVTPARGEVYGPPTAAMGMASTLPPGFPTARLIGRMHEIVKPANRILNGGTAWTTYKWDEPDQKDPQPSDSYDGAHAGTKVSWGVVDDTGDGLVTAELVAGGQRFVANARVMVGPPDYAPDRRTFASLADDLADRDLADVEVDGERSAEEITAEVADLFDRVFETVSMMNLDTARGFAILDNSGWGVSGDQWPELPKIDERTMWSPEDEPYVDQVTDLVPKSVMRQPQPEPPNDPLPYTQAARDVHGPLADIDNLLSVLRTKADHVRALLRPPWGRVAELTDRPSDTPSPGHRDPRNLRDNIADMRMPPYMRDTDESPLALSWRQYHMLMSLIDHLEQLAGDPPHPARTRLARSSPAAAHEETTS